MHDIIIQAINEKKVVKFDYHGFDRVAEPHVYGTLNGIKSILTYQIRGGSKSTPRYTTPYFCHVVVN